MFRRVLLPGDTAVIYTEVHKGVLDETFKVLYGGALNIYEMISEEMQWDGANLTLDCLWTPKNHFIWGDANHIAFSL